MKLIITGSRTIELNTRQLEDLIAFHFGTDGDLIETIVSGGCPTGPDATAKKLADNWWGDTSSGEFYIEFYADWDTHGKAAGPIRNEQMAKCGDALLLIWDGFSRGSANMKQNMLNLNKPVYELVLKRTNA